MRTKLEILDTIDALGAECYRSETMINTEKGLPGAAPGANLIEAMKPFAETLLDLRDLLIGLTEGEDGQIVRQYIAGQLRLQKADADWRATIVEIIVKEIRKAGRAASAGARPMTEEEEKAYDTEPMPGAPHGDGSEDQAPAEDGPGS